MRTYREVSFVILSMLFPALLGSTAPAAAADKVLPGREVRVTTNIADQYDPSISGNLVVYTDRRGYDADVFYTDLSTMQEVQVTNSLGNQELTDVSDGRIAFTDAGRSDVNVYSIADGSTLNVSGDSIPIAREPGIGQNIVAWEDARDGTWEIYARDLVTGEQRHITYNNNESDQRPSVNGGLIVWQRCFSWYCKILAYDWAKDLHIPVPLVTHAAKPDVHRGSIVYEGFMEGSDLDIIWYDTTTGSRLELARPGDQVNANISGDFVSFEEIGADGRYHVRLWHVPTNQVFTIETGTASGQYLNNIDGNRVVYTDDRDGQLDIYLYEFSGPAVDVEVAPWSYDFGDVETYTRKSTCVNVTNRRPDPIYILPSLTSGTTPPFFIDLPFPPPVTELGYGIDAGETFCVPVLFQPRETGPRETDLTITTDKNEFLGRVHLIGNGVAGLGNLSVAPASHPFGDVVVGSTSTAQLTISNVAHGDVLLTGIALSPDSNLNFAITSAPACPFWLPGAAADGTFSTVDVTVSFAPTTLGSASGTVGIQSFGHPLLTVSLNGKGVATPPPEAAQDLLEFFRESVQSGDLTGLGPLTSQVPRDRNTAENRLKALGNMLKSASDLIVAGRYGEACQVLNDAYLRVDGLPQPPDFAQGPATWELAERIKALCAAIGCN